MPAKSSKKGRKIGRNKRKCELYRLAGTREKNKEAQAAKRVKKEAYFERRRMEKAALKVT